MLKANGQEYGMRRANGKVKVRRRVQKQEGKGKKRERDANMVGD